ncbi:MAG TPA: 23S rRNA (pseudouridine(1915)-N(3))-methyltransferase RlmH [Pyrinomonadaceae bacterium]|nr:23S rRNA (pseudouridine(1915)-N(3))-methyltransferase RlmH [Pyrinomonadaceae bacterium]
MRLRVIWMGKTKDAHLRALSDDYLKRLSRFAKCEIAEFGDSRSGDKKVDIARDSKRISDGLHEGAVNVLLDPRGVEWSSEQLAEEMQRWQDGGTKEVTFVVGGPNGVSAELAASVDRRLSLSRLTLTHEMARVVLLEQLYRAYTIIRGLPYQK